MVSAARHVPDAFGELGDWFGELDLDGDDMKGIAMLILFLLPLLLSFGLAIFFTVLVMKASDAKYDLNEMV
ncbi:MAG: hypothetical protein HN846_04700 [Candidatus Pacebacteria bacterium]|jgi:hypothetical protein|nr:hypothetical protein [Candidatus Paceibacterota bacterium]MBT3511737.1 hypothetical protein [Candidatus Paceibacterota bacterium]MBT4004802.1 hypothetical protein [Candidatus Paceibacterota bacterium]MBT4358492.1 hypothetical protein [Candidatus Paceibacterota bacterium]MBT4680612.1 hypothetical protein [Candidatus Paceibacterota bacterium]